MFRVKNGVSAGLACIHNQSRRHLLVTVKKLRDWHPSKVISDRKSEFQARHVALESQNEIPDILKELLAEHRQIAKSASHPHIYAWRTGTLSVPSEPTDNARRRKWNNDASPTPSNPTYTHVEQGFNDNGEATAGAKILERVILKYNLYNILIIATRWMSGNHIGSSRFKHIISASVDSLRQNPAITPKN